MMVTVIRLDKHRMKMLQCKPESSLKR